MEFKKAYTQQGIIKRSNKYQIKKHYTDMTAHEKAIIQQHLLTVKKLNRHPHYIQREKECKHDIELSDILATIHRKDLHKHIIEYNETYANGRIEQRVLVRIARVYNRILNDRKKPEKCFGFVVLNLTSGQVLTGYFNSIHDTHATLRKFRYNNNLIIRPIKKGGYSWEERQNIKSNEMNYRHK